MKKERHLVLIKLGGSIITDKRHEFTAKETVIARLAREIRQAQKVTGASILLGHVVATRV